LRIITLNVNGIRSAERKGFARWLARAEPWDVVCLQEIKAGHDDIPRALHAPRKGAPRPFSRPRRRATAGVALYAKHPRGSPPGSATTNSTPRAATSKPRSAT